MIVSVMGYRVKRGCRVGFILDLLTGVYYCRGRIGAVRTVCMCVFMYAYLCVWKLVSP